MKKTTLSLLAALFLLVSFSYGQVLSSGLVDVKNGSNVTINSIQLDIDVTNNLVTATIIGPDDEYLGFGFDTTTMGEDKDILFYDSIGLSDRSFSFIGVEPSIDPIQNWSLDSDTVTGGLRTIVASRTRVATDPADFTFPSVEGSLDIVTAHGQNNDFTGSHSWHGSENRADERLSFQTLSTNNFEITNFSMSPNPAKSNLNVVLPSTIRKSKVDIYDVLGKRILSESIENSHTKTINVSAWKSGVYLVRISNDESTHTKRFVKQ